MSGKRIDAVQNKNGKSYQLAYCTTSKFKMEEIEQIGETFSVSLPNNSGAEEVKIKDAFSIQYRDIDLVEILSADISEMVFHKAIRAYEAIQVPCIVEHAGLIFSEFEDVNYPGGLTQPMWDALGDIGFIRETNAAGRQAIARAVVGYCDGMHVKTFLGDTWGVISTEPVGKREFYWDTIFKPKDVSDKASGLTYAEISEKSELGIKYKIQISQSSKAMRECLGYIAKNGDSGLF